MNLSKYFPTPHSMNLSLSLRVRYLFLTRINQVNLCTVVLYI